MSLYLCFLSLIPAAWMMVPRFSSAIAILLLGGMVFLIRFVAQHEGRKMEAEQAKERELEDR